MGKNHTSFQKGHKRTDPAQARKALEKGRAVQRAKYGEHFMAIIGYRGGLASRKSKT